MHFVLALALVLGGCAGTSAIPQRDSAPPLDLFAADSILPPDGLPPDGPALLDARPLDGPGADSTVSYVDVDPSDPQYQQIQWVAQRGIMLGCQSSPAKFCPDQPLTRAEAAVTLVRMKYGETFSYSPTPHFPNDVGTSHWAFKYIQRLADDNVTQGCAAGSYCPNDPTSRAQAAALLVRMKYGETFAYSQTPYFPNDVTVSHWAFKYIQRLADDKVTQGCGGGSYCPDNPMLRRYWAVFLFNAKTL